MCCKVKIQKKKMTSVFLFAGTLKDSEIIARCENIDFFFPRDYVENANTDAFNESKVAGVVCLSLARGRHVFLDCATQFVTKKNNLSLQYHIGKRLPEHDVKIVVVVDALDDDAVTDKLKAACKRHTVASIQELPHLSAALGNPCERALYTCGLTAMFDHGGQRVRGHVTRGYGITREACRTLREEHDHLGAGTELPGDVFELRANDNPAGRIVSVPGLDFGDFRYSHVTWKTTIKAALSAAVLEKFYNGVQRFALKDIDPTTKQDMVLEVEKSEHVLVHVASWSWYCYVIEPPK